jgi:glyoxylase-like metal-dependent hydrolase (beta-lactamase superfamily II)
MAVQRMGSQLVNWYLVEDEGRLTAIDAGLPAFAKELDADLEALGHRRTDVDAVVLTHSDADHTGMAAALRDAGARVLIHRDDDETLRKPGPKSGDGSPIHLVPLMWRPAFWRFMGGMAKRGGARPPKIENAETFADGDVLDVPGRPRVVHTPGHTSGHSALLFEDLGKLFIGDALCTWNPLSGARGPQVMPKPFNVDYEECFRSLSALQDLAADEVLPGHGDPWRGSPADAAARASAAAGR